MVGRVSSLDHVPQLSFRLVILLLQPGKATLAMSFTGELNDKMKGFYRSKYKGEDGNDRYGAVTQFEVGVS